MLFCQNITLIILFCLLLFSSKYRVNAKRVYTREYMYQIYDNFTTEQKVNLSAPAFEDFYVQVKDFNPKTRELYDYLSQVNAQHYLQLINYVVKFSSRLSIMRTGYYGTFYYDIVAPWSELGDRLTWSFMIKRFLARCDAQTYRMATQLLKEEPYRTWMRMDRDRAIRHRVKATKFSRSRTN